MKILTVMSARLMATPAAKVGGLGTRYAVMTAVVLAVILTSGCDPGSPIYVKNKRSDSISFETSFSSGRKVRGTIAPQERIIYVGEPGKVVAISIISDGEVIGKFDENEISALINARGHATSVTLVVGGGGIEADYN